MDPIVSGMKINLRVFLIFFFFEKFIKLIETMGPDNSLLAIDG